MFLSCHKLRICSNELGIPFFILLIRFLILDDYLVSVKMWPQITNHSQDLVIQSLVL